MGQDSPSFTFVDLFAGIGGFHAALSALGGECVYAVEKDAEAAAIYQHNWRTPALGDIVSDTTGRMAVPEHDVLAAGFPCQPFSKSGYQRGMDETRGTLFWNIFEILRVRQPAVVLLENVRNLAGPRHEHEWRVIIRSLRQLGYRVSSTPVVLSPHRLPPERGGRPQIRERVFIVANRVGADNAYLDIPPTVNSGRVDDWDPQSWQLRTHLPLEPTLSATDILQLRLTEAEQDWVAAWDDFVVSLRAAGVKRLPGFPIWKDAFVHREDLEVPPGTPDWKANFLHKNADFYTEHQQLIEDWLERWNHLHDFPASRRKLEWQAQDAESLRDTVMHMRPSGIRAKRQTYVPALVAITQTSILGDQLRRLSPREAARLQGLPEWFEFGEQRSAATYKQLGNGVNVGVAYYVLREHLRATERVIRREAPHLADAAAGSSESPDIAVERHWDPTREVLRRHRGVGEAPAGLRADLA